MNDLRGQRFSRLTAIRDVGSSPRKRRLWQCTCECGRMTVVESTNLVNGVTKSCGCLQAEMRVIANTTHGDCGTRLYRIWKGMLARCRNVGSTDYQWYGAKGVAVCREWHKYEHFRGWAHGAGYADDLTIDRVDPCGGYHPGNCRWATVAEQNANKRAIDEKMAYNRTRPYKHGGKVL